MTNYWTEAHTGAVIEFMTATETRRNEIVNKILSVPLYEMAQRAITSVGAVPDEDGKQDIVIHLLYNVVPKLDISKGAATLQYLWTAARNYSLSYIVGANKLNEDIDKVFIYDTVEPINLDGVKEQAKVRAKIDKELDLLLRGQRIANTTNSVFLILLRQYITDYDYDITGFGDYVCDAMKLSLITYRSICARLGMKTLHFNKPCLKVGDGDKIKRKVIGIKDGKGHIFNGIREAGLKTGCDFSAISKCCKGMAITQGHYKCKRSTVNGYKWFYYSDRAKWLKELNK